MKKILIIIVLLFLNSCSSTKFSKQILIIPKTYRGEIWIFYDQDHNRGKFKKSWGTLTLYVPKDGIIFSKYRPDEIIDVEEYYEDGEKIIPLVDTILDDKKIYPNGGGLGTLSLPDSDYKKLKYSNYTVGNNKYQDSIMPIIDDYKYIVKKYEESLTKKPTQ